VSNTAQPNNMTIPVSARELFGAERTLNTGRVRCVFWDSDERKSAWRSDGCTTIQNHATMPTQATCMCTQLTT
jgi:hypothetical protein